MVRCKYVAAVTSATNDMVTIDRNSPQSIRYTLNDTAGIDIGSEVSIKIGNHTARHESGYDDYSSRHRDNK